MVLDKEKVAQLKGKDAEDAVLKPTDRTDRVCPFVPLSFLVCGLIRMYAADISANLKNTVSKAATQKILLSLAERELVTQKTYGKATYFVAPQSSTSELAPAEIDSLSAELEKTKELVKDRTVDLKRLNAELSKVKSSPTDDDLGKTIEETQSQIERLTRALEPLRMGQAPISESDLARLDADWVRWRAEWVKRKRVFKMMWDLRADTLSSSEAAELLEDLGVEQDTSEHVELEKSELCVKAKGRK
ncbi:TBPIP protein [Rhizoctonia solani]|uniref:TBPIP protein n=1 Tax=Rhizoctonia solani TaxID=456999 RepID=A0A8H7IAW8_9AGAM|nr:TBPIP protein [Rhizoctonia solani]